MRRLTAAWVAAFRGVVAMSAFSGRAFRCLIVVCAALAMFPVRASAQSDAAKWVPVEVGDFSLEECRGKTVSRADLLGKPWLAAFIFTRCAGPCPRVSAQMKILQDKLEDLDIRLVSFTVDPENDTPEVLRRYADALGADPERWWFLTGDKATIYGLIRRSFKMPVQELTGEARVPGFEIVHSINIMHVDAEGLVIGKYNAADDVDMARLRRAVRGKPLPEDRTLLDTAEQERAARTTETSDGAGGLSVRTDVPVPEAEPPENLPEWAARLPMVNASLNGLATVLLLAGFALIKMKNVEAHKMAMLSAFSTSIVFLACYVVYHAALARYTPGYGKPFEQEGAVLYVYRAILISHILLAAVVPVLAIVTILRGLQGQWERHKRLAKVTFPIWVYVSVTGVIIYLMLYHWPVAAA
jgi:protein SCO1